jgi:hypothetical protein
MAEIHHLKTKPIAINWMCSACGVDAGCNCGAPLMSKAGRARELKESAPDRSNKSIGRELEMDASQVRRALNKGVAQATPFEPTGFLEAWKNETKRILHEDDPVQEDCDDCTSDEERWQRSLSSMAGDAVSLSSYWTRQFGNWNKFVVPQDLATLATQASEAWKQIASELTKRVK